MTKILTAHEPPPIPVRSFDWRAWVDGDEERGCGWGSTEVEALADLLNHKLADRRDLGEQQEQLFDRMQATRVIVTGDDHGVCVGGRFDAWLMWKHPDGQWVTMRKLEQERIR